MTEQFVDATNPSQATPVIPATPVALPVEKPAAPAAPATAVPAAPAALAVEGDAYAYDPTGDAGLDMALTFIGNAGIGNDDPAILAAQEGDFSILEAKLASKNIPGWQQYIALGKAAFERATTKAAEADAGLKQLVYTEAGGEAAWADIQKWAAANATPEEKVEVNKMLNAGGFQAKQAVRYLSGAYDRAGNVVREPRDGTANATRGGGAQSDNSGPLSPQQYVDAVRALNTKQRGVLDGTPEYAKLQSRRGAFRG